MSDQRAIDAATAALAGDALRPKIEAVLALPDSATAATPALEAALADGPDFQLEVVLLEALHRIRQDPQVKQELIRILDSPQAQDDAGEELYMMARIALNVVEHDTTDVLSGEGLALQALGVRPGEEPETLGVVIHGTWARNGDWWRAGGDFHTYLRTDLGLDYVYTGDEPFVWSGRNRNAARHAAAEAFADWVLKHDPGKLEVYAHSHGANVAMLSTHLGLEIDRLVMMSPPVREDYFAAWDKVRAAYNIQADFDPVVGIARGGQRFRLPHVEERILPDNGHSASHDPDVWERNKLPEYVGVR